MYDRSCVGNTYSHYLDAQEHKILQRYQSEDWHGVTSFSMGEIHQLIQGKWHLKAVTGVLFLPIHRLPPVYRGRVRSLDDNICQTWLKRFASYLFVQLLQPDAARPTV